MTSELIEGETVFAALASEWDALAVRGVTNTPFQHRVYQQAWWHDLHPEKGELQSVVVRHGDGQLAAIASFYVLDEVVYFNGCVEETDYLDIITAPESVEAAWTAVFDCLLSDRFPAWHSIDLCNIPAASPSRQIIPQLAERHGLSFCESLNEVCPVIELPDTFEAYLESIDSKQRREIRRKLRRAKGADARLHIVGPEDDIDQEVEDFLDLLQRSTFEKRDWLSDGRRALFHETARAALAAGTLQLMFMTIHGRKAAALFNMDYENRIWVYNSGLDPSMFGNLSLGVVLTAKAIEHAIENGKTQFDFLRGNETYKYRFGAEDTQIFRHQLERNP